MPPQLALQVEYLARITKILCLAVGLEVLFVLNEGPAQQHYERGEAMQS